MRYRVTFAAGLAAGFVVGARAGRERYEQMKKLARRAADSPAVQQAAGAATAQATGLAKSAKDKVTSQIKQRTPGLGRTWDARIQDRVPARWRGGKDDSEPESVNSVPSVPAPGWPADGE